MSTDHAPLIDAFASQPADLTRANALAPLGSAALLALIDRLVAAGQRSHVETLGEAALPKDVRKAARKAAYRLKSSGVAGEGARRAGMDLSLEVPTDQIAVVTAPGLTGRGWFAFASLPGTPGVQAVFGDDATLEQLEPLESVAPGRLRKVLRDTETGRDAPPKPLLVGADVAVRVLDWFAAEGAAKPGGLRPSWDHVATWRARAVALGANPERASARAQLGPELGERGAALTATADGLLDLPEAGAMAPEGPVDAMFGQIDGALHSTLVLTEPQLRERLAGIAHATVDAWLADPDTRARVAGRAELSADVVLSAGNRDAALQLLAVSDALAAGTVLPHELPLVSGALERLIDFDAAWEHYRDFLEHGAEHTHHHHDHDHG